jgi:DNA repair exonuclease SbcCD nuclease subunit
VVFEHIGVAVHGQSFSERAVTQNLAEAYPAPISGLFNIGLLHTALSGREGHDPYAPCTVEQLVAKGYDYWALGHVHQQEVVHQKPYIVFPGNIQGRHIRETGPKGCMLVTAKGQDVHLAHQDLDVLRWQRCLVDARGAKDAEAVLDRALGALQPILQDNTEHPTAVRLTMQGACRAHAELQRTPERWLQELRTRTSDLSSGRLWLEKIRIDTRSELSLDQLRARDDIYGNLLQAIQAIQPGDELFKKLDGDWQALRNRLPAELAQDPEFARLLSPETLPQWKEELASFLLPRMLSGSETQ